MQCLSVLRRYTTCMTIATRPSNVHIQRATSTQYSHYVERVGTFVSKLCEGTRTVPYNTHNIPARRQCADNLSRATLDIVARWPVKRLCLVTSQRSYALALDLLCVIWRMQFCERHGLNRRRLYYKLFLLSTNGINREQWWRIPSELLF